MAQKIMLTPEQLQQEARNLEKAANENDNLINSVSKLVEGLLSGWEGEAQRAFTNSFNTKKQTFLKLSEETRKLATKVNSFAANMQAKEHDRKGKAENLAN